MTGSLFQLIASLACGISACAVFLLIADVLKTARRQAEAAPAPEERKRVPVIFYLFYPFAPGLYRFLRAPWLRNTLDQAQETLLAAGYDQTLSAEKYLAVRILSLGTGIVLSMLLFSIGQAPGGLLALLLFCVYPAVWLKKIVRKRHLSILKALPNLLDLLTLSVEAGRDFLTALREINARRQRDALSEELDRTLHEIQLGKPRQTALREMSRRVHQADLTSVVNAIIQADELGVSIGQLLRIQGDQLRMKRFSHAEKMANEAPVKILFPVVIFIFPAVFFILMGPILSQAMQALLK